MKYCRFMRVSDAIIFNGDINFKDKAVLILKRDSKKKAFNQSLKLFNPNIIIGKYEGFTQNIITIKVEYDAFKMPRIAKRFIKFKKRA